MESMSSSHGSIEQSLDINRHQIRAASFTEFTLKEDNYPALLLLNCISLVRTFHTTMPSAAPTASQQGQLVGGHADSRPTLKEPLVYSGSLDKFIEEQDDITPVIGRAFTGVQIRDLIKAEDSVIRDVALTISQRGVVFLKNQDVTPTEMKTFMERLTQLAGCPTSSGLHVHPLTEEGSELGDQISVISSEKQKKGGGLTHQLSDVSRFASAGWHSDM